MRTAVLSSPGVGGNTLTASVAGAVGVGVAASVMRAMRNGIAGMPPGVGWGRVIPILFDGAALAAVLKLNRSFAQDGRAQGAIKKGATLTAGLDNAAARMNQRLVKPLFPRHPVGAAVGAQLQFRVQHVIAVLGA